MKEDDRHLFEGALARYMEGEPEPGDGELIAAALRESPELIRDLTGLSGVEELLRQASEPVEHGFREGLVERIRAEATGGRFVRRVRRRLAPHGARTVRSRWGPWLMLAAASIVAAVGWWRVPGPRGIAVPRLQAASLPTTRPIDPLAMLVSQAEARFAAGAGPDVVSFARGEYTLVSGSAHLRFRNGTDVVIVGPTRLGIDDALHVRLHEGTLRALVPPTAHGFMVLAPGVRYKDLGTEFGVRVPPGDGASELHVFEGQVEVFKAGQNKPEETVLGGESVRVSDGVLEPGGAAREDEFPSASSISQASWLALRDRMRADPDLVLYYPFIPDPNDPGLLRDEGRDGARANGRIEGAQWVTGRWPGKRALQFENAGDDVRLDLPGQFDQLTLAAWLKIDRVDNAEHAILNSVGWQAGGLQWQFNRRRSVASTAVFSDPKRRVISSARQLPLGKWVYWAVTIDRNTGRILHYIDGKRVCEAQIAPGSLIEPGSMAIGRWINEGPMPEIREFRGRIDELAVWRVTLPPERIEKLAQAGMPAELPEAGQADSSD